jgi:hypothetical protein
VTSSGPRTLNRTVMSILHQPSRVDVFVAMTGDAESMTSL